MPLPTYPLARGTLEIPASEVSQANAWRTGPGELALRLSIAAGGWSLDGGHGYLGLLDSSVTQRYPDMLRVFRSGMEPATTGRLRLREDGSGALDLEVALPAPPFVVPVGKLGEGVELVDQGAPLEVELHEKFTTACQVLVEMRLVGKNVVLMHDDALLGGLAFSPPPLVEALKHRRLGGRVFVAEGIARLDLDTALRSRPLSPLGAPEPTVLARDNADASEDAVFIAADDAWLEAARGGRVERR
ncbi:hypothetical protein C3B44_07305 [Corynebacterium yudongzhengii]|uniref:Uncharacterized protein n=1 Tax=Corynebacterium yudongzhengii TaxID=2080740 RepID=A0A2U1T6N6_9CORY|nr:hypothetical protein [Corynebacterium yudongzhengii]AWB82184.1 hypothetical protein C3B44_07305 [Corynebacterium yudongzhengii]PWC01635.1 hypothetical protein DF222_05830 [Corynebacterium yudongzhengii]